MEIWKVGNSDTEWVSMKVGSWDAEKVANLAGDLAIHWVARKVEHSVDSMAVEMVPQMAAATVA